jgi:thiol:disulfide interchange protein DsbD
VKVEPEIVRAGETVKLEVAVTLDPSFHTYDLDQPDLPAVASQITLEIKDPFKLLGDWIGTPAEEKFDEILKKRILVHHGSPTWWQEIQVAADAAPGEYKIAGKLRFTVCDEKGCLPPKTEKFEVSVVVEAGTGTNPAREPARAPLRDATANPPTESAASASTSKSSDISPAEATINEAATLLAELLGPMKVIHVDKQVHSLWGALAFGFLAGLILNVMPCVLPVISLKIYGFVKQAGEDRLRIRLLGLSFGAGILVVFAMLAGLAAFAGLAWGQLFQKPEFVVAMVALMVACALGMFDVYYIRLPGFVSDADAATAHKEGLIGSFFKGMLATVLATPCSGPFLGATIAYALSQPVPIIFAIYLAMGFGMAFPYVALALFPAWMKRLPRPGEWMNTFKEFMGFLLLATAVWLLWQRRDDGELVVWTVAFCISVAMAVWIYGHWSDPLASTAKRFAAPVAALLLVAAGGYFSFAVMYEPPKAVAKSNSEHWPAFDLDNLLAAREAGKTVVVDWTADW